MLYLLTLALANLEPMYTLKWGSIERLHNPFQSLFQLALMDLLTSGSIPSVVKIVLLMAL